MGYSAVKGGADAINAAEALIGRPPTEPGEPELEVRQLKDQLGPAVDKVMGEGGLYAPELAALAIKQAEGDLFEAAFLLRAYRSTLPRFGYSLPTTGAAMRVVRRISSAFKDVPGGQLLGRTRDYTQRLLDFGQLARDGRRNGGGNGTNGTASARPHADGRPTSPLPLGAGAGEGHAQHFQKVTDVMRAMGLIEPMPDPAAAEEPPDITREALRFPAPRPARLQALARGESGAMLCLAYSSLRGYGRSDHATIGELRVGDLPLRVTHPLTGGEVTVGRFRATEVEMVGAEHASDSPDRVLPRYGISYGLVFGQHERKAIAMAILDSTLQSPPGEQGSPAPANDQEMVLYHIDGIESSGFVEHLKLPHYVTFGSSLQATLAKLAEQEGTDASNAPAQAATSGCHPAPPAPPAPEDGHHGVASSQLHHHGDGVLHAHDE